MGVKDIAILNYAREGERKLSKIEGELLIPTGQRNNNFGIIKVQERQFEYKVRNRRRRICLKVSNVSKSNN